MTMTTNKIDSEQIEKSTSISNTKNNIDIVVNDTITSITSTNTTDVRKPVGDKLTKKDSTKQVEQQSVLTNDSNCKQQQQLKQQQQQQQQQQPPKLTLKSFFFPNNNESNNKPLQKKKKTHFGKADPKRDLVVLLLLCLFSYYLSQRSNTIQNNNKPIEEQLAEKLNTAIKSLTELALSKINTIHTTIIHRTRRSELDNTCPIYTSSTSIPHHTTNNNNTNLGLFAGKEYTTGDIIFNISIVDASSSFASPVLSFHYNTSTAIFIPSYSLLIKHHPSMYNINGNTIVLLNNNNNDNSNNTNFIIRATQTINCGQELFFHPQQHLYTTIQPILSQLQYETSTSTSKNVQNLYYVYQSLYSILYTLQQTIPTQSIYNLADTIAHDISQSIIKQHGLLNVKKITTPKVAKNPRQRISKDKKKIDHIQQRTEQRLYYNQLQHSKADEHIYTVVIRSIQNLIITTTNNNNIDNNYNNNNEHQSESNNNKNIYYQSLIPLLPINNQQYKEYYTEDIILHSESESEAVAASSSKNNDNADSITVLSSSMYRSIKNNTIFDLYIHGTCMYDIIMDTATTTSTTTTTTTTDDTAKVHSSVQLANRNNPVLKDTILYNIPILVLPKIVEVFDNDDNDDQMDMMTCLKTTNDNNSNCSLSDKSSGTTTIRRSRSNSQNHCYQNDISLFTLCPLSIDNQYGPLWITIPSSLQTSVLTEQGQQQQQSTISNVEYQWMTTTEPTKSTNNNNIDKENRQTIPLIGSIIYLNVVSTTKIMNGDILYSKQSLQEVMNEYFVHTSSSSSS